MINIKSVACALVGTAMLLSFAASGQTLTTIHSFHNKGQNPYSGVRNVGSHLFGTTYAGGASNAGSVYKIHLAGGNAETSYQDFTGGSDGEQPIAGLTRVGNSFYGVTNNGGAAGYGTAFKVDLNGANFTVLHTLHTTQHPAGRLIYSGGYFYGTSQVGGPYGAGTVFKMAPSGNVTVLYAFSGGTDGLNPYGGLVKIGHYLYGTAEYSAGGQGGGTIFRIKTDGSHFLVLHTFAGGGDGSNPVSALFSFPGPGSLFGVTPNGGAAGYGTVFRIDPDGSNYSTVHSFTGGDGAFPEGALLGVSHFAGRPGALTVTLYGTTTNGGIADSGTIFEIDSSGTETMLYSFTGGVDGATPQAEMINVPDSDGGPHLYGTTSGGGQWGYGTVFEFTP